MGSDSSQHRTNRVYVLTNKKHAWADRDAALSLSPLYILCHHRKVQSTLQERLLSSVLSGKYLKDQFRGMALSRRQIQPVRHSRLNIVPLSFFNFKIRLIKWLYFKPLSKFALFQKWVFILIFFFKQNTFGKDVYVCLCGNRLNSF